MATLNATTTNIRNVVLIGHGGNGKTSLCEAMLYLAKETDRLGKISEGNTCSDYDAEEIKRKFSLSTSVSPFTWNDKKINIIDTPGYLDFSGEVVEGLRVGGCAVIVMDAKGGVDAGSELAWRYATNAKVPKAFFVNKMDDENANFSKTIDEMREKFGIAVCPVVIPLIEDRKPIGFVNLIKRIARMYDGGESREVPIPEKFNEKVDNFRGMLMESLAETSDELMEKFFAGEEFSIEEMQDALNKGIMQGIIAPVFVGSATTLSGVTPFLNIMSASFPNPLHKIQERTDDGEKIDIDVNGKTAIFVFKTIADPFGKISFFKVMNGKLTKDMTLNNLNTGAQEKFSHIYVMRGKKQTEVDYLECGDIGVTTKLVNTNTNDTLCVDTCPKYETIKFPHPYQCMAIVPKAKGDEDKISSGITKLLEEDLTIKYQNNAETKELLISGMGEQHLDVVLSKLKNRFGTSVELKIPKIAYRETIKKRADAEGKHKKQSGGHGQYGHVKIHFEPGEAEGLTFTESVVGGTVPKNFHPAVEKGLLEAMQKGVLAGYPVVNLKADLYDGSYHDVDSSEMSFKMAASLAYKDGLPKANPIILEPVGSLKVYVSEDYTGDIYGDISKRRGRVLGMNPTDEKGINCIEAEVPQAEMTNYTISLRAMTQGRGSFDYAFERYEEAPAPVAQKIIEDAKKNAEAE